MRALIHITKHELLLIFREPRFWVPFLLPPLILFFSIMILAYHRVAGFSDSSFLSLPFLSGILITPMVAPLIADSFAGEKERKSLELLLMLPVSHYRLFLGKIMAVLPFPLIFSILIQLPFQMFFPEFSIEIYLKSVLGIFSSSLIVCGFSLMVSLSVSSVKAATQGSILCVIPLFLLVQWGYDFYFHTPYLPVIIFLLSLLFFSVSIFRGYRKFHCV